MGSFTEQEWKQVLPLLHNFKPERIKTAYNRLVLGMTLAQSGEEFGYSRQDVSYLVTDVKKKFKRVQEVPELRVPEGWIQIRVLVPRSRVKDVRKLIESLYPLPSNDKK